MKCTERREEEEDGKKSLSGKYGASILLSPQFSSARFGQVEDADSPIGLTVILAYFTAKMGLHYFLFCCTPVLCCLLIGIHLGGCNINWKWNASDLSPWSASLLQETLFWGKKWGLPAAVPKTFSTGCVKNQPWVHKRGLILLYLITGDPGLGYSISPCLLE